MIDTIQCSWCGTTFKPKSARAKFCSEACKQKNKRKSKVDDTLVSKGLPPTAQASKIPTPPKKEDAQFVQTYDPDTKRPTPGSPEWYIHGTLDDPHKTWDKVCVRCGKAFTTSLELMGFCSSDCKSEVMVVIAEGPHKDYIKWRDK